MLKSHLGDSDVEVKHRVVADSRWIVNVILQHLCFSVAIMSILGNWDVPLRENLFIFSSALPGVGRVSGTFQ